MASPIVKVLIEGKNNIKEATSGASKDLEGMSKVSHIATGVMAGGLAAVAAGAFEFGKSSLEAADKFDTANAKLQVSIKNTKGHYDQLKPSIDSAIQSGIKFGFTSDETVTALATMTTGMGSTKKATDNFQLAMDIAARTGKPLSEAALLVTKAYEGQTKPLKQLGIDLPIATGGAVKLQAANVKLVKATQNLTDVEQKIHDGRLKGPAAANALTKASNALRDAQAGVNDKSQSGTLILKALEDKLKGSASTAADTFAGKQRELKARLDEVQVQIGHKLQPVLLGLESWILKSGIPAVGKLGGAFDAVGSGIGNVAYQISNIWSETDRSTNKAVQDSIRNLAAISAVGSLGTFTGNAGKGGLFHAAPGSKRAAGGPVDAGGAYLVGEKGPEILQMGRNSGHIIPNGALGGGGSSHVIMNFPAGSAPAAVAAAQARWNKRNGRA